MSKLSKNIIYNTVGQGSLLIFSFIAVKYIFKQLGEDTLGIIYFTAMLNALLSSLAQMGISTTTVREISSHYRVEKEYIYNLIRTLSLFYWSFYFIIGILIYYYSPIIVDKWINLKTIDKETAVFMVKILGIASIIALPKSLYISLFRGIERMEFNNAIEVITTGIQQLGVIILLSFKATLYQVVYWYAACYYARILIYILFVVQFFSIKALIPGFSLSVIKRNLDFSVKMILSSIISRIYVHADRIIISKLLPISTLGYYSIAYNSCVKGRALAWNISVAAFPNLSSIQRRENHIILISQYRKLQDLICYGMIPIYGFIIFIFLPVFSYILTKEIAQSLLLPVVLLCLGFYMQNTGNIPHYFSLAVGKPEISLRLNLYVLIINLPLTFILIFYFGLTGAALSVISSRIISYSYGVPRICKECLKITPREWYAHVLRVFILSTLTYGIAWIVTLINGKFTFLALLTSYIVSTLAFLTGTFYMIGNELRTTMFSYFQSLKKRLFSLG